jgi:hypothetical protein
MPNRSLLKEQLKSIITGAIVMSVTGLSSVSPDRAIKIPLPHRENMDLYMALVEVSPERAIKIHYHLGRRGKEEL